MATLAGGVGTRGVPVAVLDPPTARSHMGTAGAVTRLTTNSQL